MCLERLRGETGNGREDFLESSLLGHGFRSDVVDVDEV